MYRFGIRVWGGVGGGGLHNIFTYSYLNFCCCFLVLTCSQEDYIAELQEKLRKLKARVSKEKVSLFIAVFLQAQPAQTVDKLWVIVT